MSPRRIVLTVFVALAVAVAGFAIWSRREAPPAEPPAVPAGVDDEAVVEALNVERAKVLADPRSPKAWGDLGHSFFANDLTGEACRCFEQAERLEPEKAAWPYLQGLIRQRSDPDFARERFERALTLATARDEASAVRVTLADHHRERGEIDVAKRWVTEELGRNPSSPQARYMLGAIELQFGEAAAAIERLKPLLDVPMLQANVRHLLAEAYRRTGDYKRAEAHTTPGQAELPAARWPNPFLATVQSRVAGRTNTMNHAAALMQAGQIEEALKLLQNNSVMYPDVQTHSTYATALVQLERWEQAESVAQLAIECDPERAESHHLRGRIQYELAERLASRDSDGARDRYRSAKKSFETALTRAPSHAKSLLSLARTESRLGDLDSAARICRLAIDANPSDPNTHRAMAEIHIRRQRPVEAIPFLEHAARLSVDPSEANAELARVREGLTKPK